MISDLITLLALLIWCIQRLLVEHIWYGLKKRGMHTTFDTSSCGIPGKLTVFTISVISKFFAICHLQTCQ